MITSDVVRTFAGSEHVVLTQGLECSCTVINSVACIVGDDLTVVSAPPAMLALGLTCAL